MEVGSDWGHLIVGMWHVCMVPTCPGGLTAQAIEAVKKWRLSPATGPDGKPAAVRQIIEVTFKLF
jgi:hypothetical protein